MAGLSLYTTYYNETNPIRRKELDEAITRNCVNPWFQRVYVICEGTVEPPLHHKILCIHNSKRPTYQSVIAHMPLKQVGIIVNTDCYFEGNPLPRDFWARDVAFAITRKEAHMEYGFLCLDGSQDAWAFVKHDDDWRCDWAFGKPHCENIFATELRRKYQFVENPGKEVNLIHLHASCVRTYTDHDRVIGNESDVRFR